MLLRDVMMPLPLREDWGEEMEWPYPGVPASLVAEFAGHRVAGLPFFAPETITTDHGSVYKNHHLIDVQRVIGADILPARVLRPTDPALPCPHQPGEVSESPGGHTGMHARLGAARQASARPRRG